MQIYAKLDPTGTYPQELRTFIVELDEPPVGMVAMPTAKTINDCASLMLVNGLWVARPIIERPIIESIADGFSVVFAFVPTTGTTCTVLDLDYSVMLGEIVAENMEIMFQIASAGRYQLEVTAPLPWIGLTLNVVLE